MKYSKILLILLLFTLGIRLNGQTTSEICITPNEYRFYVGAVIDRQFLILDTARLDSVITGLRFEIGSLESSLAKSEAVGEKMGEKEAIYTHKIDELFDDVDKYKKKTVRNRRLAIVGGFASVVEAVVISLGVYFTTR